MESPLVRWIQDYELKLTERYGLGSCFSGKSSKLILCLHFAASSYINMWNALLGHNWTVCSVSHHKYRWRELTQVSRVCRDIKKRLLSRQKYFIRGSCHKYRFCRDKYVFCFDKSVAATNTCLCLSQQTFCSDKNIFVATKYVLSRQKWYLWQLPIKIKVYLLRQNFCRDKHFCHDKNVFVATKVSLSRQNFCLDKIMFVATSILLSQQIRVCRDKTLGEMSGRGWRG